MLGRSRPYAAWAWRVFTPVALIVLVLAASPGSAAEETRTDEKPDPPRSITSNLGPRTSLHGFAHVTFGAERAETPDGDTESRSTFALGEFDLYFTSQLTKSLSFLGETVIEFEDGGETRIDVERLFIKWALSDPLWVSLGRRHTPLGYWNETYHHGFLLQPTVSRPLVLRFEDDEGILPVHTVGAMAGGRVFSGPWVFDYIGGIANGRGLDREEVQNSGDVNQQKAVILKMTFIRQARGKFRFGVPGERDAEATALGGIVGIAAETHEPAHLLFAHYLETPSRNRWEKAGGDYPPACRRRID